MHFTICILGLSSIRKLDIVNKSHKTMNFFFTGVFLILVKTEAQKDEVLWLRLFKELMTTVKVKFEFPDTLFNFYLHYQVHKSWNCKRILRLFRINLCMGLSLPERSCNTDEIGLFWHIPLLIPFLQVPGHSVTPDVNRIRTAWGCCS